MDSQTKIQLFGNRIIGFGKHKNLSYSELVETQKEYTSWLFSRDSFQELHPDLHEYLSYMGFKSEEKSEEGYDYNSLQEEFAVMEVVRKFLHPKAIIDNAVFEHLRDSISAVVYYHFVKNGWVFSYDDKYVFSITLQKKNKHPKN